MFFGDEAANVDALSSIRDYPSSNLPSPLDYTGC